MPETDCFDEIVQLAAEGLGAEGVTEAAKMYFRSIIYIAVTAASSRDAQKSKDTEQRLAGSPMLYPVPQSIDSDSRICNLFPSSFQAEEEKE